jgi:hypothetical protein
MALFSRLSRPSKPPEVEVIGARESFWADLYHSLLRTSWSLLLIGIALAFLLSNAVFALLYRRRA